MSLQPVKVAIGGINLMKRILITFGLLLLGASVGYSQSSPAMDGSNRNEVRHERNWSWVGLIGLAGLAGLKRQKSETHSALESHGVNVKTVRT